MCDFARLHSRYPAVDDPPDLSPDVGGDVERAVGEVAAGSFRRKLPPEIRGTGYVVASLEAALWAFAGKNSFQDAALQAVNLGDDADTTGAVLGQLAGACHGESAIPGRWLECLAMRELIGSNADGLRAAAWRRQPGMTGDGTKVSRGVTSEG